MKILQLVRGHSGEDFSRARHILILMVVAAMAGIIMSMGAVEVYKRFKGLVFAIDGVLAVLLISSSIMRSRLWLYYDSFLLCLFTSLSCLSAVTNGISLSSFLFSQYMSIWITILALYFVIQTFSDSKRYISIFYFFASLILGLLLICVTAHAVISLLFPGFGQDFIKGCFLNGRMCAIGNANYLGFSCAALMLMSAFGLLTDYHKSRALKIYYIVTMIIGWFCLGLSGCRTAMVGVSFALGLWSCIYIKDKLHNANISLPVSLIAATVIFLLLLESFELPISICKGLVFVLGEMIDGSGSDKIMSISAHRISEDDGTLTDRTLIWAAGLKACFKNMRRFIWGISPLGKEGISGVYAGHHEVIISHAHNAYIEILRKHGIVGFITMMSLIFAWIINGLRQIFNKAADHGDKFLAGSMITVLIMGICEPMPFANTSETLITVPFFLASGYCIKAGRS
ncbi:O-antigen ligase family protein [Butyrivibrio sp. MC2013]|uniref:O-antigen ligase family protein n=1 Tax=Butyrivibrio sp. MC2013 TaxID=1280686 RepID=UPI00042570CF|nr:O-antigen ligase family protein [Butyrivibrio sp. MC2013]